MAGSDGKGKTVALVLGSGGARGYAHIGVIEVLQERGYNIVAVSGCSIGAMVAGVYAAGKLQEFKDWATGLDQFEVFKLMDLSILSPGAIRGKRVFSFVKELVGDIKIEDLPLPYTAVATDLLAQKEVWFQEGMLHEAMRASIAIPSFLAPVMSRGRLLVDGGLLNPLPIFPTISSHADLILAVNLSWETGGKVRMPSLKISSEESKIDHWFEKLKSKTSLLFDKDDAKHKATDDITVFSSEGTKDQGNKADYSADKTKKLDQSGANEKVLGIKKISNKPSSYEESVLSNSADAGDATGSAEELFEVVESGGRLPFGMFDIMNLSFEAMQSALTDYKLAGYPPDVLVNIPKHSCRTFDFHKAPELIQLGRKQAIKALEEFEAKCDTFTEY